MDELIKIANTNADKVAERKFQTKMENEKWAMVNQLNRPQPVEVKLHIEPKPIELINAWIITIVASSLWLILIFLLLDMMKAKGLI